MEDLMMGCKVDGEQININRSLKYCGQEEEMIGVREENLRLKTLLQKIEKDYKSLQMKYINVFQQESRKNGSPIPATAEMMMKSDDQDQELVSLRLGTSSADSKKGHNSHVDTKSGSVDQDEAVKAGPEDDPATSKREDDRGGERAVKAQRSGDDEFSQTSVKRARVCVRARCDTPTMNDGCQWRKYGQKISKGNPCPRAYYRCTVSPTCPVRKQVQRFVEDMSILITTYEGTHNHPLPLSATAMASTTSAAASMLLSGSTTSQPSSIVPTINMYGQPTFHPYDTSRTQPPPPYFISNSSSNSSPTITLDLIANPQSSNTGFGLYSSTSPTNPRFPTTNLSFSSMDSNMAPTVWGGGYTNQLMMGRTGIAQQQKFEPYAANLNQASSQNALTETLTKVISSDPSFRSAIAAAISTMAASAGARKKDGEVIKGENLVANSKWGEQVPAADPNSLS